MGSRTMKQSNASRGEVPGRGATFSSRHRRPCSYPGHRHLGRHRRTAARARPAPKRIGSASASLRPLAAGRTPLREIAWSPNATSRSAVSGRARRSWRLAGALGPSVRARYTARARCLSGTSGPQASWIKPRRTRALPDLASPSPAAGPALVGRAGEPGIASDGPSIAKVAREDLLTRISAVSMPTPTIRASRRPSHAAPLLAPDYKRSRRARSIASICSRTGQAAPDRVATRPACSAGRRVLRREYGPSSAASPLAAVPLEARMPSRARALFIRMTMRVRRRPGSPRSRLGRLASSSSTEGIATIPQWPRSPRSQPEHSASARVSRRSVWARLCSARLPRWSHV